MHLIMIDHTPKTMTPLWYHVYMTGYLPGSSTPVLSTAVSSTPISSTQFFKSKSIFSLI